MNERNYKITDEDIERYIERQLVITLRTLFTLDEKYNYSKDDTCSEFTITGDFPLRDAPGKETGIVVTGISYTLNLQNTLNQNFSEEVFAKNNKGEPVLVGEVHRAPIPFNCTVMCEGEMNYVKDLSNKVANILAFTGKKVIEKLGLTLYNISKGSCQPKIQHPSKIFQVPVSVSGYITWMGTYKYMDPDKIDNLLKEVKITFEVEQNKLSQTTGSPGVYVNQK